MRRRLFLSLILLWWALCLFSYAHVPPSPDDTDIDYMGWMLLRGGVQYVDFIDMNWPGGVWLHATSTLVFGNNLMSWRIFDFAIAIVALLAMIDLVSRAYGRGAAIWLAILYPALYVTLGIWMSGQRDTVAGHGLIIALCCHARAWERQQLKWQACAGVALGMAILVKPTIGFAGPLLVLHGIVWSFRGAGLARAMVHGLVAGASALGVLVLGLLAVLALGAPLEAVIEGAYLLNQLGHHIATVAGRSFGAGIYNVTIGLLVWVTGLAAAGALLLALDRSRSLANKLLFAVPIAAALINYQVQTKFFEYHLTPAFPALVVLACVALAEASRRLRSGPTPIRAGAALVIALAVLGTSIKVGRLTYPVLLYRLGRIDRTEYYGRFRPFQIDYGQLLLLAERIERDVPEGGTVLMWGSENALNYLADRPQPTRFHHWVALSYAKPPLPMADKWNRWFAEDLTTHSPEMAVIDRDSLEGSAARGADNHFFLTHFLEAHYRKIETIDEVDVYVRDDFTPRPRAP